MNLKNLFLYILMGMFFLPFGAVKAEPTDPDCLTVPTERPIEDGELSSADVGVRPERVPVNQASLFATGIIFSDLIYDMPDLEITTDSDEFVKKYQAFFKKIPKGYELYHLSSDPMNGLKYGIFKPKELSPFTPWVLAVAGTQTLLDAMIDGSMGRRQMERLTNLFSKCIFQDEAGRPRLDIPLVFVGHSLGGGLLQALYHQIQGKLRTLRARGHQSPLHLITFNAFGGRDLLDEIRSPYVESYIQPERVKNYYIRGDLVAKIGTHIGPSYEMVPYMPDGKIREFKITEAKLAHALASFTTLTNISAGLGHKMPSEPKSPNSSGLLRLFYNQIPGELASLILYRGAGVLYVKRSNELAMANFLSNLIRRVTTLGMEEVANTSLLKYTALILKDEEIRLRTRPVLGRRLKLAADDLNITFIESLQGVENQLNETLRSSLKKYRAKFSCIFLKAGYRLAMSFPGKIRPWLVSIVLLALISFVSWKFYKQGRAPVPKILVKVNRPIPKALREDMQNDLDLYYDPSTAKELKLKLTTQLAVREELRIKDDLLEMLKRPDLESRTIALRHLNFYNDPNTENLLLNSLKEPHDEKFGIILFQIWPSRQGERRHTALKSFLSPIDHSAKFSSLEKFYLEMALYRMQKSESAEKKTLATKLARYLPVLAANKDVSQEEIDKVRVILGFAASESEVKDWSLNILRKKGKDWAGLQQIPTLTVEVIKGLKNLCPADRFVILEKALLSPESIAPVAKAAARELAFHPGAQAKKIIEKFKPQKEIFNEKELSMLKSRISDPKARDFCRPAKLKSQSA